MTIATKAMTIEFKQSKVFKKCDVKYKNSSYILAATGSSSRDALVLTKEPPNTALTCLGIAYD